MALLAGFVLCTTNACVIPFTSIGVPRADPRIATRYEPPAIYDQWWAVAESCAHEKKNLRHWKWYAVKPPHLDNFAWESGLPTERNEVYVHEGHILDSTEVMTDMVVLLTPYVPFSGDPDRQFFQRTLACVGIRNSAARTWRHTAHAQAPRDLSTPATRVVGHWVTPGNTHYYFGPTDTLTDVGALTSVELGADGRVVKHRYKIITQVPNGEKLSIQILFGAGGSRVDPYVVAKDGQSMRSTVTVAGITIENTFTYVDDRTRPE